MPVLKKTRNAGYPSFKQIYVLIFKKLINIFYFLEQFYDCRSIDHKIQRVTRHYLFPFPVYIIDIFLWCVVFVIIDEPISMVIIN